MSQRKSLKSLDGIEALCNRVNFAIENNLSYLAYCTIRRVVAEIDNFSPYDEESLIRKREVDRLYIETSMKMKIEGLSIKRTIIILINKMFPRFLFLINRYLK